ncbi:hypothetical protein FHS42_000987 [Streptomyces zagrosensis]|uniref:Uncharacterized protein n=1 Tax=Streptomyces zagrosensis TaxID=1042984 RepID=A0A7W9UX63_9ACTN|nr:hypothetical protein [Streptomyces zagrosensis]
MRWEVCSQMPPPKPNTNLEGLFQETGWTLRQFAQAVNHTATEAGTPTMYRAASGLGRRSCEAAGLRPGPSIVGRR